MSGISFLDELFLALKQQLKEVLVEVGQWRQLILHLQRWHKYVNNLLT
jgi:hypothetical protein